MPENKFSFKTKHAFCVCLILTNHFPLMIPFLRCYFYWVRHFSEAQNWVFSGNRQTVEASVAASENGFIQLTHMLKTQQLESESNITMCSLGV